MQDLLIFQTSSQIRSEDNKHKLVFDLDAQQLELHEAGNIRFLTGDPATEQLRLTAAGKVGIGTTTPATQLEVAGDIKANGIIRATDAFRPSTDDWEIARNGEDLEIREPEQNKVWARFKDDQSLHLIGTPNLWVDGNAGIGTTTPGASLHVSSGRDWRHPQLKVTQTSNTDWARIVLNANGNEFHLAVSAPGVSRNVLNVWSSTSKRNILTVASPDRVGILTENPGWTLHVNGSAAKPGGGSWTNSSDIRLKKNVQRLEGALDKLLQLRGVSFEWKEPEKHGNLTDTQMDMIAQEVESVFPEWVGTDSDGYKDLTFRGFEALTVEAFRELEAKNEILKAKNEELEGRIKALEAKLNAG